MREADLTLTTLEVAAVLQVSPVTVRSFVRRGQLEPVERGVRPLRFEQGDVWAFKQSRTPPDELRRRRELAARWADS